VLNGGNTIGRLYREVCAFIIYYYLLLYFTGGKKCLKCGLRIYHDKWNISPQLAEERWAHKEAREREIEEVSDFLDLM